MDSIIEVKNKKLKPLRFTLEKTITAKTVSGDSTVYDFTLNTANGGATANAKKYSAFIGKALPLFIAKDIYGKTISVKDLKGYLIVTNS